mgnify:FL=1
MLFCHPFLKPDWLICGMHVEHAHLSRRVGMFTAFDASFQPHFVAHKTEVITIVKS